MRRIKIVGGDLNSVASKKFKIHFSFINFEFYFDNCSCYLELKFMFFIDNICNDCREFSITITIFWMETNFKVTCFWCWNDPFTFVRFFWKLFIFFFEDKAALYGTSEFISNLKWHGFGWINIYLSEIWMFRTYKYFL